MIRDLHQLKGPAMIFGGPYSNLQATRALFAEAERLDIPPSNIICTGDIIAYAGDPVETLDAIIHSGINVVMGNCEESFGNDGADCGCGFEEGSACDLLSKQWYDHANSLLSPWHREWMRGLPEHIRFSLGNFRFAAIHGGTRDISRWIFKSTPEQVKRDEIDELGWCAPVDGVIAGHCGLPFVDDLGDKIWINPGVIGMPANDGTRRTWYGILYARDDGLHTHIRELNYDHDRTAERMSEAGLASAYADSLISGIWPNMDVLPEEERRQAVQPIQPSDTVWNPVDRDARVLAGASSSIAEDHVL